LIDHYGLAGFVNLHGWVSREQMPAIMQAHDVLLFPVLWNEPLARIVQEAMATGLVVVGTLTGGTDEILRDHYNGLAVPTDDADALTDRITELIQHSDLIEQFALSARRTVEGTFTVDRMLDEVEAVLERARAHRRLGPPLPPAHSQPLFDLKRWVNRPIKATDYWHARLGDEQHLAVDAQWLGVAQE
jgi:glycosyltransferase involved in cell wall biosynthesis